MADPCTSCCEIHPYGDPCVVPPDDIGDDDELFQCHRHGTMTGLVCSGCYDDDIATARREERERCAELLDEAADINPMDSDTNELYSYREGYKECGENLAAAIRELIEPTPDPEG